MLGSAPFLFVVGFDFGFAFGLASFFLLAALVSSASFPCLSVTFVENASV